MSKASSSLPMLSCYLHCLRASPAEGSWGQSPSMCDIMCQRGLGCG